MKKSLLVITACIAFSSAAFSAVDEPKNNREILGGYMKAETDGKAEFNGFNLEIRKHINDFISWGGGINYGYDKGNGLDFEIASIDANLMAKLPIGDFYLYGEAGVSYTSLSFSGYTCTIYGCVDIDANDGDLAPIYGFGVSIPLKDRWLVDVSYTKRENEFDFGYNAKVKTEIDSVFVQVGYSF